MCPILLYSTFPYKIYCNTVTVIIYMLILYEIKFSLLIYLREKERGGGYVCVFIINKTFASKTS